MSYEFQEFPKWITPPGAEPRIVQNEQEEQEAMGKKAESVEVEVEAPKRLGRPPRVPA